MLPRQPMISCSVLKNRIEGISQRLVEIAHQQQLAARPQHRQALADAVARADVVDHHIDALACVNAATAVSSDWSLGIDPDRAVLRPPAPAAPTGGWSPDFRPGAAGDLHAVDAEPADAEDQHALPDADPTLVHQAVVHAGDGVGQNRRRSIGNLRPAPRPGSLAGTST